MKREFQSHERSVDRTDPKADLIFKSLAYLESKTKNMAPAMQDQLQNLEVICSLTHSSDREWANLVRSSSGYFIHVSHRIHMPHWAAHQTEPSEDDLLFPLVFKIVQPKTLPEILTALDNEKAQRAVDYLAWWGPRCACRAPVPGLEIMSPLECPSGRELKLEWW